MLALTEVKKSEEQILHHLMQFYIYEFSKLNSDIKLEADGRFKPFSLEKYWKDSGYYAFFIKDRADIIGFTLVEAADNTNKILEFFIMGSYHRSGYDKISSIPVIQPVSEKMVCVTNCCECCSKSVLAACH